MFAENNLLITAWTIDSDELELGISHLANNWAESYGQKYRFFFDCVYIFAKKSLIELDLEKAIMSSRCIGKEGMNAISNSAFKDILGISRDEYYRRQLYPYSERNFRSSINRLDLSCYRRIERP